MTIFREMVAAWYSWHFDENRGKCATEGEWLNLVKSECWKLYPDIGTDTGVRNAIIELIGQDLSGLWQSREGREGLVSHLPNNGLPSDQELLQGLWRELGVIPNGTVSKVLTPQPKAADATSAPEGLDLAPEAPPASN